MYQVCLCMHICVDMHVCMCVCGCVIYVYIYTICVYYMHILFIIYVCLYFFCDPRYDAHIHSYARCRSVHGFRSTLLFFFPFYPLHTHTHTRALSLSLSFFLSFFLSIRSDGIDFFFNSRADAKHFCDFLAAVSPVRSVLVCSLSHLNHSRLV